MENLLFLCVPKFGHITCQLQCAKNIRTPNNHHFSFATNGKIVVLGVPILKHFRVTCFGKSVKVFTGEFSAFTNNLGKIQ